MENNKEHPKVLIEEWFPFEEISIECQRERGVVSALPAIYFLHTWWARRPLVASRAAILASILPAQFNIEIFNQIMGYSKNLKNENKKIQKAKKQDIRLKQGFSSDRCFKKSYDIGEIEKYYKDFWKKEKLEFLDPMSGGGSIPFEGLKLGLNVYSSELNSVATVILNSTLIYPLRFDKKIIPKIKFYAKEIVEKNNFLLELFPLSNNEVEFDAFIWVRTIKCPSPDCGLEIPLFPNWAVSKKQKMFCKLVYSQDYSKKDCNIKLINERNTSEPTIKRGKGFCPRCKSPLPNEYIKSEAQANRMGHKLVCIVSKTTNGLKNRKKRNFRMPSQNDIKILEDVDKIIEKKIGGWKSKNLLPDEDFPSGSDNRPIKYGAEKWYKLFNKRQLLANMSILESIVDLRDNLLKDPKNDLEEVRAIITYLQLALDKVIAYNSIQSGWHSGRSVIGPAFVRHDFAVRWTYAEMDIIRKGFDWAVENVIKSLNGLIDLIGKQKSYAKVFQSSASDLKVIINNTIDVIVVDPPYYNNVMYSELSDFYYVWMKRSLHNLYPELFSSILTDKDNEAVANPSKFKGMGNSERILAKQDYEAKMKKCFQEMHRVLQHHGVLTIMFTHKSTDAWDTLTMSLMEAGFEITASWPVHTEAQLSLHIAKKNAVKTTIFLVCRKRIAKLEDLWWEDDILPSIKKVVKLKAEEFRKLGIDGVDLFISCFGPALKEFSKIYPVRNIAGEVVRAEEAIEAARKVVIEITLQNIIKGKSYNIDSVSKFYLTAWHFFKARSFPFDEARRLALSIGINIDELKMSHRLLIKKGGDVELLLPKDREKSGAINVENPKDDGILINAVHIALLAYEQGGQKLFDNVVEKLRRNTDKSFRLYMETLFNVLPDVKDLAKNLPEKKILGEILMTTEEKITPKGGKITDFLEK